MAQASADGDNSTEYYRRGGFSPGAAATGLMVAISSTFALSVWGGAVLDAEGVDLRGAVIGELSWAAAGVAIGFLTIVFLSFLWGGYTAGRMGVDLGWLNGLLVAILAVLFGAAVATILVLALDIDSIQFPFGIRTLPLNARFTGAGFGVVGAILAAVFGGSIWGGVNGSRWHLRVEDELEEARYQITSTDSFSDLRG